MKIISAEYIKSFTKLQDFDLEILPVIAFIGRSNVGKSSLINHLLNRKNLVKTSSTPGKTQLINFFLINNEFYFVDLPGYGFANVPVKVKNKWQIMINNFLMAYQDLRLVFQLVDIRRSPSEHDIDFQNTLNQNQLTNLVIANKIDKLQKNKIKAAREEIQNKINLPGLPLIHSSLKKIGSKDIWSVIESVLFIQEEN